METMRKQPLIFGCPTRKQLAVIRTFCQHNKQLFDKSNQDSPVATRCWQELASILNEMSGPKKTAIGWRDSLRAMKNSMRLRVHKKRKQVPVTAPITVPMTNDFVDVDLPGNSRNPSVATLTPKKQYSYMAKLGTSAQSFAPGDRLQPTAVSFNLAESKSHESNPVVGTKDSHATLAWRKVFADFIHCELERYADADAQRLKNQLTEVCLNFMPQEAQSSREAKKSHKISSLK